MLKTLNTKSAKPRKGGVGVGDDSKARRNESEIDKNEMDDVEVDSGKVRDDEVEKKDRKTSKSKNLFKSNKTVRLAFPIPGARLVFTELKQTFLKAPIFYHFDLEHHIQNEMDISGYAIGGVLSQLTLDNSGRWHPVAFYFQKIIPAKTRYKIHDDKLLAIVKVFKTWMHYLEKSQHEVLVLTNHNNFCQFMDMKSLSSKQVCWAQKLSFYHFWIDYSQGKANGVAYALSQYPQQSAEEEKILWAENVKILYRL